MKNYYVYILCNKPKGMIYIGVTSDLEKRIWEHKEGLVEGFTRKYNIHRLVYFEQTNDVRVALIRERQLKKWNRQWKIELIEDMNPEWKRLF